HHPPAAVTRGRADERSARHRLGRAPLHGRSGPEPGHLRQIATLIPPSSQQKYSNIGYQLLGEIVSRVSGRPYAEYVSARILQPLGMAATGFLPLGAELDARRAVGYGARGFSDELTPAAEPPLVQAEGGLLSCVDDLVRWIGFQLHPAGDQRDQVLSTET